MTEDILKMDEYMQNWLKKSEDYQADLHHWKPSDKDWSLQQVLLHLLQVHQGSLDMLQKEIADLDAKENQGIKSWYSFIMLKLALKSSKKFKAPRAISNVSNDVPINEIASQWNETQKKLLKFIEKYSASIKNKLIFKHPVVGWITLGQTTDFLLNHLKHHQKQIDLLYLQIDKK